MFLVNMSLEILLFLASIQRNGISHQCLFPNPVVWPDLRIRLTVDRALLDWKDKTLFLALFYSSRLTMYLLLACCLARKLVV